MKMDCQKLNKFYKENKFDDVQNFVLSISKELKDQKLNIVELITSLKDLLISQDIDERFNGVSFLSSILSELNNSLLNEAQVKCLFDFYMDRSKDDIKILEPFAKGLNALIQYQNFNFSQAELLYHALQSSIAIQMCPPSTRKHLYILADNLFNRFSQLFIDSGACFVFAFLSIVDGETSSTVLEQVFKMYYVVARIEAFIPFKEDIFESMCGYFPILYSEENDPKVLRIKKNIHHSLLKALTAEKWFSDFVFSLALEKMESISIYSKMSSYDLIIRNLRSNSWQQIAPYAFELWTNIRIDTLKCNDYDRKLGERALTVLSNIGSWIDLNDFNGTEPELFSKIWTDLKVALQTPSLKLVVPASNILSKFSSSCKLFRTLYFRKINELLLETFFLSQEVSEKGDCLDGINRMFHHIFSCSSKRTNFTKHDFFRDYFPKILDESLKIISESFIEHTCNFIINYSLCFNITDLIAYISVYLDQVRRLPNFFRLFYTYIRIVELFCRNYPSSTLEHYLEPLLSRMEARLEKSNFNFDMESQLDFRVILHACRQPKILVCLKDFSLRLAKKIEVYEQKHLYFNFVLSILSYSDNEFTFLLPSRIEAGNYFRLFSIGFFPRFLELLFTEIFHKKFILQSSTAVYLVKLLKTVVFLRTSYSASNILKDLIFFKNFQRLLPTDSECKKIFNLSDMDYNETLFYLNVCNAYLCSTSIVYNSEKILKQILNDILLMKVDNQDISFLLTQNISAILSRCKSFEDFDRKTSMIIEFIENHKHKLSGNFFPHLMAGLFSVSYCKNYSNSNRLLENLMNSWTEQIRQKYSPFLLSDPNWFDIGNFFYFRQTHDSDRSKVDHLEIDLQYTRQIMERCSQNNIYLNHFFFVEFFTSIYRSNSFDEGIRENCLQLLIDGIITYIDYSEIVMKSIQILRMFEENDINLLEKYLLRLTKACVNCSLKSKTLRVRREVLIFITGVIQSFKNDPTLISLKNELAVTIRPTLSDNKRLVRTVAANLNIRLMMLGQPGY